MKENTPKKFSVISWKFPAMIGVLLFTAYACTPQMPNQSPAQTALPTEVPLTPRAVPTIENQIPLDLKEANIVAVSFELSENRNYRFDVTLQHDDEGEVPNYADFWQVEDLDGNVLGKRILTHSHSNAPFTRSETITIPQGITQVIVRGHDMNHGFGGQAMRVDLSIGETVAFTEGETAP